MNGVDNEPIICNFRLAQYLLKYWSQKNTHAHIHAVQHAEQLLVSSSMPRMTCLKFEDGAPGIATVAHAGSAGFAKLAAVHHVGRQRVVGLSVMTVRAPFTAGYARVKGGGGGQLSSGG